MESDGEKSREIVERTSPCRDRDAGADEEAHHVVQEAVRLDDEGEPSGAFAPAGVRHDAAMIMRVRGGTAGGEGDKPVIAHDLPCDRVERAAIDRLVQRPLGAPSEGGPCVVIRSNVVRVPAGERAEPCMELGAHVVRRRNPHVIGKERVDGATQRGRVPLLRHPHSHHLPARMYTRVRATSPVGHDSITAQRGEHPLHFTLNGPPFGLDLPPGKRGSVVVQHKLQGAHRHRAES